MTFFGDIVNALVGIAATTIAAAAAGSTTALWRWVMSRAARDLEMQNASALGRLGDAAARAAAQLNAVILADPLATAAIGAAKDKLVTDFHRNFSQTFTRLGGSLRSAENLVLGEAAKLLPAAALERGAGLTFTTPLDGDPGPQPVLQAFSKAAGLVQ